MRRIRRETRPWPRDFSTFFTPLRMALLFLQMGPLRSIRENFYHEHYSQTDITKLNLLGNLINLPE